MSKQSKSPFTPREPLQAIVCEQRGGNFWDIVASLPGDVPLLCMGGARSEWSFLALSWEEVDWRELSGEKLSETLIASDPKVPARYVLGTFVFHSYDHWAGYGPALPRAFRVRRAWVRHESSGEAWLFEEPEAAACPYQVPWPVPHKREEPNPEEAVTWNLEDSDAAYLDRVLQVQEDIRNGRYYQLNLLRFWFSQGSVSRAYWLARLKAAGGPFAALVEMPDLGLVSCSPERFVEIQEGQERNFTIRTEPIKGTRPVHNDPEKDQQERLDLAQHPKDRAELSMIVDLMRNDLQKVCQARSVRVLDPGSVHSFSHVHHLIAQIEGRVRPEVRWQDIWTALCPGGSITGAPKIEVMKTISEYESRPRSYLMGHIFYLDAYSGCCDSSILIRTAERRADGSWCYAAGSGLTLQSDPETERYEVLAKARVILDSF